MTGPGSWRTERELRDMLASLSLLAPRETRLRAARDMDAPDSWLAEGAIEEFELPNAVGNPVRLSSMLRRGPCVLLLYRGCWNAADWLRLRSFDGLVAAMEAVGGRCASLSPLTPARCMIAVQRAGVSVEILSDMGAVVSRRLSGAEKLSADALWALRRLKVNPIVHYGLPHPWLAAPALFVIDPRGRIRWRVGFGAGAGDRVLDVEPLLRAVRDAAGPSVGAR